LLCFTSCEYEVAFGLSSVSRLAGVERWLNCHRLFSFWSSVWNVRSLMGVTLKRRILRSSTLWRGPGKNTRCSLFLVSGVFTCDVWRSGVEFCCTKYCRFLTHCGSWNITRSRTLLGMLCAIESFWGRLPLSPDKLFERKQRGTNYGWDNAFFFVCFVLTLKNSSVLSVRYALGTVWYLNHNQTSQGHNKSLARRFDVERCVLFYWGKPGQVVV